MTLSVPGAKTETPPTTPSA